MFKQIIEAFRDLVIGLLPVSWCPKVKEKDFAFLCHPLDAADAARKYPFTRGISEGLFQLWTHHFWPIMGAKITGAKKTDGTDCQGWAIVTPLTPAAMVQDPEAGRKMIIRGVRFCEKLGFKLVALGGYNSIITRDGADLIGKVNLSVTTGNSYSALLVIQNFQKVTKELGLEPKNLKIAVVGAAGSVGWAVSHIMASMVKELWLMDLNKKGLGELVAEIEAQGNKVKTFDDLLEVKNMDIVVTATSTPRAIIQEDHLRSGMIFIDAAQPKNVSEDIARGREDVLVIDSGIARVPSLLCDMQMGPYENEAYACLGEAMVLACHRRVCSFSIGKVDPAKVRELSGLLDPIGFRVADFRNAAGYFPEARIPEFKEKYLRRVVKK